MLFEAKESVYLDLAFMVFGLGFFLLTAVFVAAFSFYTFKQQSDTKMAQAREFGYEGSLLQQEAKAIETKANKKK